MSRWVIRQADLTGVEPVSDIEFTSAPYLTNTLTTWNLPATEAHHRGVTLWTDLQIFRRVKS